MILKLTQYGFVAHQYYKDNMDSLLINIIKIENNRVHVLPTEISPTPHEDLICQLQDQDTRVQTDEIDVLK